MNDLENNFIAELKEFKKKENRKLFLLSILLIFPLLIILILSYNGAIKTLEGFDTLSDFFVFAILTLFLYIPLYLFGRRQRSIGLIPVCPNCKGQLHSTTLKKALQTKKCPYCGRNL